MQRAPSPGTVGAVPGNGRRALTLVAAFVVSVLLAGCGPSEPDITPPPTPAETETAAATHTPTSGPYYSDPPTSEAEAIEHATNAYRNFLAVVASVYAAPSDTGLISSIARHDAESELINGSTTLADNGAIADYSGTYFTPDDSASIVTNGTRVDGTALNYSEVDLRGCLNAEDRTITNSDGTPGEMPQPRVYRVIVSVSFDEPSGQWFVNRQDAEGDASGTTIPC